jgi:hypothetical protein
MTGTTRQRARFFVALAMLTLTFLTVMGRGATEVLYQINRPFCWTSVQVRVVVQYVHPPFLPAFTHLLSHGGID